MNQATVDVKVSNILAGKLRRYHGSSFFKVARYTDYNTEHIRRVSSSTGLFAKLDKIDYLAAKSNIFKRWFCVLTSRLCGILLRIPMVIHDSDAHAGLTNRISTAC